MSRVRQAWREEASGPVARAARHLTGPEKRAAACVSHASSIDPGRTRLNPHPRKNAKIRENGDKRPRNDDFSFMRNDRRRMRGDRRCTHSDRACIYGDLSFMHNDR